MAVLAAAGTAFSVVKSALSILDATIQAVREINKLVSLLQINISQEDEILKQIGLLGSFLQNLRAQLDAGKEEPTTGMIQGLENLRQQMEKCMAYCKPSGERTDHNKAFLELCAGMEKKQVSIEKCVKYAGELWTVKERNEMVKSLKEGLSSAIQMIQLILQLEDRERITKKRNEKIPQSEMMNVALGISGCYSVSDLHDKPPGKIFNVQAKIKGDDRMELTWDYDGDNKNVREYEVHISREGKSFPATRITEQAIVICSPIIIPGKRYAFQIRPISKSGYPGDLSEEMKIRFLTAAPAAPSTPHATACNINEIKITVTYPEEDCNGSSATHCIVELFNTDDDDCDKWTRLNQYELHEGAYAPEVFKETVNDLQECCTYKIRVCFANNVGESPPSEFITCKTLGPFPGPPTRFRFSSYRTADMIKLRWNVPNVYPRFVHHYEIEFRERTLGGPRWKTAGETERLSFRVKELSQDTRYYFRIRSISEGGRESVWTHEIDVTTRFSDLAKAALTPFAFVGATAVREVVSKEKILSFNAAAKGLLGSEGWTIGSILLAPFEPGGAAVYSLITEGDEYSEQSDEN